jgi:uncharacterized protein (TIGR02757 family)
MKARLQALRARYETPEALALDPLSIPRRFEDPLDREAAAFVAAHLAYGRVAPMLRAIEGALSPLGPRPAAWLRERGPSRARAELSKALRTWAWRFHTGADLAHWMAAWAALDAECGQGLEAHLLPEQGATADEALSRLVQRLRRELPDTYGLRFNLPDPLEGSACKRWRMFLRWMVRRGWPDLGTWTRYPAESLVIPLDTHVARVARFIGLSRRATPDGKMAAEVTEALRRRDPQDPLAYDFALSHLGILGDCPGVRSLPGCRPCPLVGVCRAGKG